VYQQKITLTTETRKVTKLTDFLGYEGENKINELVFEFKDGFVEGIAKLVLLRENADAGYIYLDRVGETYVLPIKSALISKNGDITFCLTITNEADETIVKYNPFVMTVKDAPDTDIPMPEDYPTWQKLMDDKIQEADNKIQEMDDALIQLKEELSLLTPFEREIIEQRYVQDLTQQEIASNLGVSQVQVSRNEKKVLVKLKNKLVA